MVAAVVESSNTHRVYEDSSDTLGADVPGFRVKRAGGSEINCVRYQFFRKYPRIVGNKITENAYILPNSGMQNINRHQ